MDMSVSIFGLCPNLWTLLNVNDRPQPNYYSEPFLSLLEYISALCVLFLSPFTFFVFRVT